MEEKETLPMLISRELGISSEEIVRTLLEIKCHYLELALSNQSDTEKVLENADFLEVIIKMVTP